MGEERSINKLVQLVKLDNKCCLFSRRFLESSLRSAFALSEFSNHPGKYFFTKDGKNFRTFVGGGRKQKIPYIQKFNFIYIDKSRKTNSKELLYPKKAYKKFILLETKKDLAYFMDNEIDFCAFPDESEMRQLVEKYKKAGLRSIPQFYATAGYEIPPELEKQFLDAMTIIVKVNVDFIWEKQKRLRKYVADYLSGKLKEHQLLWLNQQLENVSPVFLNQENQLWEKIQKRGLFEKKATDEKVAGMTELKNVFPADSYRIYGHFALCCLELFLDMQTDLPFYNCEDCGQLNYKKPGSKLKKCPPEENEKCRKRRQRKRKAVSERVKKIRKKDKLAKISKIIQSTND